MGHISEISNLVLLLCYFPRALASAAGLVFFFCKVVEVGRTVCLKGVISYCCFCFVMKAEEIALTLAIFMLSSLSPGSNSEVMKWGPRGPLGWGFFRCSSGTFCINQGHLRSLIKYRLLFIYFFSRQGLVFQANADSSVTHSECCFSKLQAKPTNLHFNKLWGVATKFVETIAPKSISRW